MSLLDGKIEAAAGTVVGAQDQHHIFVADRAAQRFLVVYQRHGMNSVRRQFQTEFGSSIEDFLESIYLAGVISSIPVSRSTPGASNAAIRCSG